jgi:hypothetical protein
MLIESYYLDCTLKVHHTYMYSRKHSYQNVQTISVLSLPSKRERYTS